MGKRRSELWMTLDSEEPIGRKFFDIQDTLGLSSRPAVVRHLVKMYDLEAVKATFGRVSKNV